MGLRRRKGLASGVQIRHQTRSQDLRSDSTFLFPPRFRSAPEGRVYTKGLQKACFTRASAGTRRKKRRPSLPSSRPSGLMLPRKLSRQTAVSGKHSIRDEFLLLIWIMTSCVRSEISPPPSPLFLFSEFHEPSKRTAVFKSVSSAGHS